MEDNKRTKERLITAYGIDMALTGGNFVAMLFGLIVDTGWALFVPLLNFSVFLWMAWLAIERRQDIRDLDDLPRG